MYKQINERARISIEQDTGDVPADGKYYVIADGEIVSGFRALKAAQALYRELIKKKNLPKLEQPTLPSDAEMLSEAWSLRSNKSLLGNGRMGKQKKSGRFHKVR